MIFVDTSAFYALLFAQDPSHTRVDWVSFDVMRTMDVETAFAFDAHFLQQGFRCIPGANSPNQKQAE